VNALYTFGASPDNRSATPLNAAMCDTRRNEPVKT
jgi:hypothetical protein